MHKLVNEYIETGSQEVLETIFSEYKQMIYSLANKYEGKIMSYEFCDLVAVGYINLEKAAKSYEMTATCSFSTYAYSIINNGYIYLIRYQSAQKRNIGNYITFESNFSNTNLTFEDVLCDPQVNYYDAISNVTMEDCLEVLKTILSERDFELYTLYLQDNDLNTIAEKFNWTQQRVRNRITYIKRKIKAHCRKK